MPNQNQIPPSDDRIGKALSVAQAEQQRAPVAISQAAGGMLIQNAEHAKAVASAMAASGVAVRPFMRNNLGTCLAVVIQAVEWRMSPFAVAAKAYSVNDQLAYESQLVQAVILQRAPIKGRMRFRYEGEGQDRRCIVRAYLRDDEAVEPGDFVELETPKLRDIKPQNSPLWKSDPDQQFSYYGGRALCRRYFPDVLLGVFAEDEIDRDAPPPNPGNGGRRAARPSTIGGRMDQLAAPADTGGPVIDNAVDEPRARQAYDAMERAGVMSTEDAARARADSIVAERAAAEASAERPRDTEADFPAEQDAAVASGGPDGETVEQGGYTDGGDDRVPDGAGQGTPPQDDDAFPGDVPMPRDARKAEIMSALRQAASDGGKALDAAVKRFPADDLDLISAEDSRGIRVIADEVDQRSQRRGRR